MGHTPKWRLPFTAGRGPRELSAAFIAKRFNIKDAKKCKCGKVALRGSKYCKSHGGLLSALKAEAERYDRPVIAVRRSRQAALAKRGSEEPWPDGLPKLDRLMNLGPMQRGRLFEAWENRLTAPDVWANELAMPRYQYERDRRR